MAQKTDLYKRFNMKKRKDYMKYNKKKTDK